MGRAAFIIADVSGKGLAAALLTAMLQEDESAALPKSPDAPPGSLLRAVVEPVAAVHRGRVPDLGAGPTLDDDALAGLVQELKTAWP